MLTKVQLLEKGVGSVDAVASHHIQSLAMSADLSIDWPIFIANMKKLGSTEDGRRALGAIICSLANIGLEDHGYLHSLDDAGSVNRSYLSMSAERPIVCAAISGD